MDWLMFQDIVFIVLSLGVLQASGAVCPAANTVWNSCTANGGTETITLDWTTYPSMACQEVQIIIPENYGMDSCTWRVELTNIPGSISTGITVNAVFNGVADVADPLVITSEKLGVQTEEFSGSLDDMYTDANFRSSVPPLMTSDGQADAVDISFTRTSSTAFIGAGFTLRVVLYAIDAATVCADVSSPKTIELTSDYPKAVLATPNFPNDYPASSECYTNVNGPVGMQIRVDYLFIDLISIQDNVFIFDSSTAGSPVLLRVETTAVVDASGLDQRSFDSETNSLHISFQDTITSRDPGVLILLSVVEASSITTSCIECICPGDSTSSGTPCDIGGTFFPIASGPTEPACDVNTPINLDWMEAESYAFLATPSYGAGAYMDTDTSPCQWRVYGPHNSVLIVIFKDFDLGSRDTFFITPTMNQGRTFRMSGRDPMITYNDGSGEAMFRLIDSEIDTRSNRATFGLTLSDADGDTGRGVSLEVRLVDKRCDPRCLNGGQCSCSCTSGFRGILCNLVIPIEVALVSPPAASSSTATITEGESIEIECAGATRIIDETTIQLQVLADSTAFEGPIYDFPSLTSYACVIAAGTRSATVTVPTIDDTIKEAAEELIITAGTITGGADPTAGDASPSFTVTIMDTPDSDQIEVDFSNTLYEVSEGIGTFTGTIEFKYLNTLYPIPEAGTIDLAYSYDTASASDITAVTTLNFIASSQPMTSTVLFEIPIVDDSDEEPIEMFHINLYLSGSPDSIKEGAVARTTVWIEDNDTPDNAVIIYNHLIARLSSLEALIFAFSNPNLAMTWTKEEPPSGPRPLFTRTNLVIDGAQYGETLTLPLSNWRPERRIGHFTFTLGSNVAINAFVKIDSDCLSFSRNTITVYPSASDNSVLSEALVLSLETPLGNSCPTDLTWEKNGQKISNNGRTYTTTTTSDAGGTFTVFSSPRQEQGWFAITEVTVSDCPVNIYKDNTGACTLTCPNCQNGGVCELDGTCTCPPCFFGALCQYKHTVAGTFGKHGRFLCSALHSSVANTADCKGFLFCYGGLYGCSCGCGWTGSDCELACGTGDYTGRYGANCGQECTGCTNAECDPFTGCP